MSWRTKESLWKRRTQEAGPLTMKLCEFDVYWYNQSKPCAQEIMINYVIIQALDSSPSKLAYRKYRYINCFSRCRFHLQAVDDTTCCFKLTTSGGGSKSKRSCKAGSHRALWMARMKWITEIPWYTSVCKLQIGGSFFGCGVFQFDMGTSWNWRR